MSNNSTDEKLTRIERKIDELTTVARENTVSLLALPKFLESMKLTLGEFRRDIRSRIKEMRGQ